MAGQRRFLAASGCSLAAIILFYGPALAFDLNGMWASDTGYCDKIFAVKGKQAAFREDSDMFGSGFIFDAGKIRGRTASCKIIKTRTEGTTIYIVSYCATDIMLSNVEFTLKIIDENQIDRVFPGFEDPHSHISGVHHLARSNKLDRTGSTEILSSSAWKR